VRSQYHWNSGSHEDRKILISRGNMQLEDVLGFAKQLSLVDKVRLIERMAPEIERDLTTTHKTSRQSLWGICAGLGNAPSATEIDRTRQEEWANFPREDF
jgi:hypothetical protein